MTIFKKAALSIVFGTMLMLSNKVNAQCLQPTWASCQPACANGDTISYNNIDWIVINSGSTFIVPSEVYPATLAYTRIPGACASTSEPFVDATEHRATYCRTSFGVGNISSNGGAALTARGFVYGETSGLTLESADALILLDGSMTSGNETDEFEGLMENLSPETTYYVQTYATNSIGTTYGTEVSFTTRADVDCASDCDLACDMTTPGLYNPSVADLNTTYATIGIDDTICITEDRAYSGSNVDGMLKVCNGAVLTISGSMNVHTKEDGALYNGQIVYEGCNELIEGTGSYQGTQIFPATGIPDPKQMISYCGTCDDNDQGQFLDLDNTIHLWAATCRPTTVLLPVELSYFGVSSHDEGAILNWTTVSEIENSHFEVEVSYDGINWYSIGIVQGAGNSTDEIEYSFIDNQLNEGVQYYRLKQFDFDGTEHISNIRYYSTDSKAEPKLFIAFQNESKQVEVQAKFSGMGEVMLIDTRGRIVENKTFISTNKAGTKVVFDSINLAEGVYFVKIKSGNVTLGEKVQIIK